ncbi:MAG: hypothetical protein AB1489_00810 [Acidobacteriota bacterium]
MYCPSCGTVLSQGLSYCNRCGAKVISHTTNPLEQQNKPKNLLEIIQYISIATVIVGLGGLFFTTILAIKLLNKDFAFRHLIVVLILFLLTTFGISAMLLRQLSRVLSVYLGTKASDESKQAALTEGPPLQFDVPKQPIASVTEHTTRKFEPIHRQQNIQ